jgi:hypothetical protein
MPLGGILLVLLGGILFWTQLAPQPSDEPATALLNGFSRAGFLIFTGAILYALTRTATSALLRFAPLLLLLVAWADVFTHQPAQNPTVPPWIYSPGMARDRLALTPPPTLGGSRVMVSPSAAQDFVSFGSHNSKDNFIAKQLGYCANGNLLDAVPKVDGFFSLTPRESDEVLSLFYTTTNATYSGFENFLGVSHRTAPDAVFHWQSRANFLPLVTVGQNPVFLDDQNTLSALTRNNFDGSKVVFLPEQSRSLVTVSNSTEAKILSSKFGNDTADIEAEAATPSLIVVAQTYYHNWQAEIDGVPTPLLRANVAFQAVQIPAGTHKIHLFYRDRAFAIGATISICMWIFCLVSLLLIYGRFGCKKESPPA